MIHTLPEDWKVLLESETNKPYFINLQVFLEQEYMAHTIYPAKQDLFNALKMTPYKHIKAVILGQDPYHGPGQAHGLSFSVQKGTAIPPSLRHIFKELHTDLGCGIPSHGYLEHWARQGVLLLNTVLTVRQGQAHSHKNKGWEHFTDHIIRLLNHRKETVVFILWGKPAQQKAKLITAPHHLLIQSVHPSPLSAHRGFFGSRPFSKTNSYLIQSGQEPIDWYIPE